MQIRVKKVGHTGLSLTTTDNEFYSYLALGLLFLSLRRRERMEKNKGKSIRSRAITETVLESIRRMSKTRLGKFKGKGEYPIDRLTLGTLYWGSNVKYQKLFCEIHIGRIV